MVTLKAGKGFGKRLRALRKAAGLTQAALGEQAGVHPVSIAQYETGACNPSEKTAARLRAYFEGLPDKSAVAGPAKRAVVVEQKQGRLIAKTDFTEGDAVVLAKKRGRPRKAKPEVDEKPKRVKWGRPKKVAEVIEQTVVVEAEVPDEPKRTLPKKNVAVTPARLGMVSKDWLEQQVESHIRGCGFLLREGPISIVILNRRDLIALCQLMLRVGGVQVEGE